ncbi:MAG: flagellar filament capping protein FliD [Firmicutes bacterium]|nr:flagellar filament capping protein FliD [Bacillota bacterium]
MLRIGGIASGLDTEQIVSDLMRAERIPLDRVYQQKVLAEWKRSSYRDVNTKLLRLRNAAFDLRLQSSFLPRTVASSDASKITATATGGSVSGNYRIQVGKLADIGMHKTSTGVGKDFSTYVSELEEPATIYLRAKDGTVKGIEITASDDINSFVKKINDNSKELGFNAYYDSYADQLVLSTNSTGVSSTIEVVNQGATDFFDVVLGLNTGSVSVINQEGAIEISLHEDQLTEGLKVTIGNKTYAIWDSTSFLYPSEEAASLGMQADVVYDLNNGVEGFLNIIIDELPEGINGVIQDGKLVLTSQEPETNLPEVYVSNVIVRGSNAELTINGVSTQRESNTFDLSGTNVTLRNTTDSPVTISVEHDVDKVYENIKSFVDLYNEIIDELNVLIREPRFRDYAPLTDEQKKEMSDKEIELWEERAKSGLLRGDTVISGILSDVRLSLTSAVGDVEGPYKLLSQIGITTGAWSENGKLHINESKLKEAIRTNPDGVMELFTKATEEDSQGGIARRVYASIDKGFNRIVEIAGKDSVVYDQSTIGEQIRSYESRIEAMEERLTRLENRYWNQFVAMERAMAELNQQADWLYQQLMAFGGQ